MYQITDAHGLTIFIIMAAFLVTPFYVLATFVFSGASAVKGAVLGSLFLLFGAFMFWACLFGLPGKLGLPGNLIVPAVWILPSLILFFKRDWVLEHPLSQKWIIGLQLFRAIGGVFLIEMVRGNVPAVFAYPAGLGDILAATVALGVLVRYRTDSTVSRAGIRLVIVVGVLDFISAFFFGFTSAESPLQLFYPVEPSRLIWFPTGLIPMFLVPYAIFFHTLSYLNAVKFQATSEG